MDEYDGDGSCEYDEGGPLLAYTCRPVEVGEIGAYFGCPWGEGDQDMRNSSVRL